MFVALAPASAAVQEVDLGKLLVEIRTDIASQQTNVAQLSSIQYWTPLLESAIEAHPEDQNRFAARSTLAGLYMSDGRAGEAQWLLDTVIDESSDPGTILRATLDAARATILARESVAGFLSYTGSFVSRVRVYRSNGVAYPSSFDGLYDEIGRIEGEMLIASARWILATPNGVPGEAEAFAAILLEEAGRSYGKHVDFLSTNGDPALIALYLFEQASVTSEAAGLLTDLGDITSAHTLHAQAVLYLEDLITGYGMTPRGQNAATLLLREKFLSGVSAKDYADYARVLARRIAPGHEIITFLRSEAINLSQVPTTLVAANLLFELILELEREWFPLEHRDHVNYQWSLLVFAKNQLKMGDVNGAHSAIDELEGLEIRGEVLNRIFGDVQKAQAAHQVIEAATVYHPESGADSALESPNQHVLADSSLDSSPRLLAADPLPQPAPPSRHWFSVSWLIAAAGFVAVGGILVMLRTKP